MSIDIISIPSSAAEMAGECIKLIDAQKAGQVTPEEAATVVGGWKKYVPSILFAGEGNTSELNPRLLKLIGKRRATVVMALLNS